MISEERTHYSLGLISTLIALFSWAVVITIFAYLAYLDITSPGALDELDETSTTGLTLISVLIGSLLFSLGALILGVVGLFVRLQSRVFCVLGIVLSLALFAGIGVLVVIGGMEA